MSGFEPPSVHKKDATRVSAAHEHSLHYEKFADGSVKCIEDEIPFALPDVGDLLLQKNFISDHITKINRRNRGELPQYFISDDHEPIISREMFDAVQKEHVLCLAKYAGATGKSLNIGMELSSREGQYIRFVFQFPAPTLQNRPESEKVEYENQQ